MGGNWAMAGWVDRARVSKDGSTRTKAFDADWGLCQIDDVALPKEALNNCGRHILFRAVYRLVGVIAKDVVMAAIHASQPKNRSKRKLMC
jgi:hypothetical protein